MNVWERCITRIKHLQVLGKNIWWILLIKLHSSTSKEVFCRTEFNFVTNLQNLEERKWVVAYLKTSCKNPICKEKRLVLSQKKIFVKGHLKSAAFATSFFRVKPILGFEILYLSKAFKPDGSSIILIIHLLGPTLTEYNKRLESHVHPL